MTLKSGLKSTGGCLLYVGLVLLFMFLAVAFVNGMVWVSAKVLPWLVILAWVVFAVCLVILLPLGIFKKTRPWAGVGFFYSSYAFGMLLW